MRKWRYQTSKDEWNKIFEEVFISKNVSIANTIKMILAVQSGTRRFSFTSSLVFQYMLDSSSFYLSKTYKRNSDERRS
jgi:hypothetical protein